MTAFDQFVSRIDAAGDVPLQLAQDLITGVRRQSIALQLGRHVPLSTRESKLPVLVSLPDAYFVDTSVDPDSGLKQTTKATFDNFPIVAEEIASICPVPINVIDDSQFPVWESIQPLLSEACARTLDKAILFGVNAPTTWPTGGLVADAVTAGNVVEDDVFAADADNPRNLLLGAAMVGMQGYSVTGSAVSPGWQWRSAANRTQSVVVNPLAASSPFPLTTAGLGIRVDPLTWPAIASEYPDAIVANWDNLIVGIRSDIKIEIFREGIISDSDGKVVLNLMQNDSIAARVTMRVGTMIAKPPTDFCNQDADPTHRSPAAVVQWQPPEEPASSKGPVRSGRRAAGH